MSLPMTGVPSARESVMADLRAVEPAPVCAVPSGGGNARPDRRRPHSGEARRPASEARGVRGSIVSVVPVAVITEDQFTEDLVVNGLEAVEALTPVPSLRADEAEVVLAVVDDLDEGVLSQLAQVAQGSGRSMRPIVLVCHRFGEHQMLRAMDHGLVSVLFRGETTLDGVARALLGSQRGHAEMPHEVLGALLRRMRMMRSTNSPSTQVSVREVDVIRLLAEGLGTLEVAAKLNFSERTIKNIVAGLSARFELQNRAHLVAFAFRNGII